MSFFEVDKDGLAKIAARRGKAFVLFELLQNAWDVPGTSCVKVNFQPEPGRPLASLTVEDDSPDGFKDLAHAYTLFAESEKKDDPTKRGRFNFGEKLVLALCKEAEIITTTGSVRFDKDGRHVGRKKLSHGSVFTGLVQMTREEYNEALSALRYVLPPLPTFINGDRLPERKPVAVGTEVLPTEVSDEEGIIRRRQRRTEVRIYEVHEGEVATLYEMGIPVIETGDKYHVDVQQKVPLNMERDNVTPAYLREVRTVVLNQLHDKLVSAEEAAAPWVRDAMSSDMVSGDAIVQVMDTRFGKRRVIFDPSDPEANNIAMSKGMTVIHGASLTRDEWTNVKQFAAALPAGQVTPSPKPYDVNGHIQMVIPRSEYSPALAKVVDYFIEMGKQLLCKVITIDVVDDSAWRFAATYGQGRLSLNYHAIKGDVESLDRQNLNELLIHELAHDFEKNHLAAGFHEACCKLGTMLVEVALQRPELFEGLR